MAMVILARLIRAWGRCTALLRALSGVTGRQDFVRYFAAFSQSIRRPRGLVGLGLFARDLRAHGRLSTIVSEPGVQ